LLSFDDELLIGTLLILKEAAANNDKNKLEELRKNAQNTFRKSNKLSKEKS